MVDRKTVIARTKAIAARNEQAIEAAPKGPLTYVAALDDRIPDVCRLADGLPYVGIHDTGDANNPCRCVGVVRGADDA